MTSEIPLKKRIEEFPAGTVRIITPADPAKLAALQAEKENIKAKNPEYIPVHVRFGDKPFTGRSFKRVPRG